MITLEQAKNGIARFIDSVILPQLSGFKKVGLGAYTALALQNFEKTLLRYKDSPAVSMLGIIDSSNNTIDIDRLYNAVAPRFEGKQSIDIPMLGVFTFDRSDIERLYNFMKER